jgi:hypothetical protein
LKQVRKVKTEQIAEAMGAKKVTVIDRLRRLRDRGAIAGGRAEGWTAVV